MSRPVRDAGEDLEDFELRCVKWEDDRRFRRLATEKTWLRGKIRCRPEPEIEIDLEQAGAWVPVRVFVTWKEAGRLLRTEIEGASVELPERTSHEPEA